MAREWVRGVRLGVDVGTVRVGVAISDPDGILATPLVTLRRDLTRCVISRSSDAATTSLQLVRLVEDHESVEVVVGLPVTLAGYREPRRDACPGICTAARAGDRAGPGTADRREDVDRSRNT